MRQQLLFLGSLVASLAAATPALAQTMAYVQWPLTRNANDSSQVRRPITGLTASPGTFKKLVLSSGTANATTAAVAPYSSNGQAFATSATGTNGSTTTPGGPRRAFFEQFAITNSGTTALRVDSLLLSASTTNSGNGQLALSYSLTGFATDSIDFAGGKGPAGVLPATANGSWGSVVVDKPSTTSIALPAFSATAAPAASTFRMAFVNTGSGISIAAGRTLTVRLYFRVGSNTDGRYFILKNVVLKSTQPAVLATKVSSGLTSLTMYPNPATNQLLVQHETAGSAAQVRVFNATGACVRTQTAQAGTRQTTLACGELASGIYLVEYTDGERRAASRLVKE